MRETTEWRAAPRRRLEYAQGFSRDSNPFELYANNPRYLEYQLKHKNRYIYFLRCPDHGKIRYIGCSYDPEKRLYSHAYRLSACAPWIRNLRAQRKQPVLQVLIGPIHVTDAVLVEGRLIALHQFCYPGQLLNREDCRNFLFTNDLPILENIRTNFPDWGLSQLPISV